MLHYQVTAPHFQVRHATFPNNGVYNMQIKCANENSNTMAGELNTILSTGTIHQLCTCVSYKWRFMAKECTANEICEAVSQSGFTTAFVSGWLNTFAPCQIMTTENKTTVKYRNFFFAKTLFIIKAHRCAAHQMLKLLCIIPCKTPN